MARELFVYWRAAAAVAPQARAAAQALQHRLRRDHPGLLARLYQRAETAAADGAGMTLMETYARPPAGIDVALQAAINAAGAAALSPWCQDGRHTEAFDGLDA